MPNSPSDTGEPEATILRSLEEIQAKQQANMLAWRLGRTKRWDADLDIGQIKFSDPDGYQVVAPLQVIGSYNPEYGTWLWGWDHPSVDEPFAQAARAARRFGVQYGLARYTERLVHCSEDDAWEFTAVALHLWGGAGAYRGPGEESYVFMTFGDVTIRRVN